MKYFIEQSGLKPLKEQVARTGQLSITQDASGRVHATPAPEPGTADSQTTLAAKVSYWLEKVATALPDIQKVTAGDIENRIEFFAQVNARPEPDFDALKKLLPQDIKSQPSDAIQGPLIDELNRLLQQPTLHKHVVFPGSPGGLPAEANELNKLLTRPFPEATSPEVYLRYNRLLLQALFPALARRAPHQLQRIAGPRYWQPNEPVVLLHGPEAKPTERHGDRQSVKCSIVHVDGEFPQAAEKLEKAAASQGTPAPSTRPGYSQPWNPFLLEWQVELWPTAAVESNLDPKNRAYDPKFIIKNYKLPEDKGDLCYQAGKDNQKGARCIYSGQSILTPHAKFALLGQIDEYLEQRLLHDFFKAKKVPDADRTKDYFAKNRQTIVNWYNRQAEKDPFTDSILKIETKVGPDFHVLDQALSGFNAGLLGHKQTMQLPVDEPLGFPEYQTFTKQVSQAVGPCNRVAPVPLNDFNPIRTGILSLARFRLIDTFGQIKDVKVDPVLAADALLVPDKTTFISLPLRLAQPARLNLRWLSGGHDPGHQDEAERDEVEMNTHPASSPICGWLLPNNLDNSLMVYDCGGQMLGLINQNCKIQAPPGHSSAGAEEAIAAWKKKDTQAPTGINPHLYRVVSHILARKLDFLQNFITALDSALENIDPENFAQHQGLALLMGRPLAVVRAKISLELKGLPAINHDWTVFRQDMQTGIREDDRVKAVNFPVRLGEHRQLNDGLAGYWKEDSAQLSPVFYSPQAAPETDTTDANTLYEKMLVAKIQTYAPKKTREQQKKARAAAEALNLQLALEDPPQTLTMLVDPRGQVHATSGILPTKAISIPPDQYAAALQAIEIAFLSTPILSTRQSSQTMEKRIELPLPVEPGYTWSWAERDKQQWDESSKIANVNPQAHFTGSQEAREGWLILRKTTSKRQVVKGHEHSEPELKRT